MKKLFLLFFLWHAASDCTAQTVVNLVLLNQGKITEDIKEATHFILVKDMNGIFERNDYKLRGPLIRVQNYSDSNLSILNGRYYQYAEDGSLEYSGQYKENRKEGDWFIYNDTGKVILQENYENGVLVKTINPDSVKKIKDTLKYADEKEASFKGGVKSLRKFLISNLDADKGLSSVKGGSVRVGFTVNESGRLVDIYLQKSVEYVLDDEAVRVIYKMPAWEPAFQNGKHVKAYRIQPITFIKE